MNDISQITKEFIENYSKENEFDLLPTQGKISFPLIRKYILMLQDNREPPPIKVGDDIIVDGHHRYICGHICGKNAPNVTWMRSPSTPVGTWQSVEVDIQSYESGYDGND